MSLAEKYFTNIIIGEDPIASVKNQVLFMSKHIERKKPPKS